MIRIQKGLDLPIAGSPEQSIEEAPAVQHVALVADDYVGMRPTMAVKVGDHVKLGQLLFHDKKQEGVAYTSPGCGEVVQINRGAKRKFESLVIRLDGEAEETFASSPATDLDRQTVCDQLVASGLWTALRTRPFSKVPPVDGVPAALFITAIDTRPLAPDPAVVLEATADDFMRGVEICSRFTDGPVYLCKRAGA